jgi:hypothetical protein
MLNFHKEALKIKKKIEQVSSKENQVQESVLAIFKDILGIENPSRFISDVYIKKDVLVCTFQNKTIANELHFKRELFLERLKVFGITKIKIQ